MLPSTKLANCDPLFALSPNSVQRQKRPAFEEDPCSGGLQRFFSRKLAFVPPSSLSLQISGCQNCFNQPGSFAGEQKGSCLTKIWFGATLPDVPRFFLGIGWCSQQTSSTKAFVFWSTANLQTHRRDMFAVLVLQPFPSNPLNSLWQKRTAENERLIRSCNL